MDRFPSLNGFLVWGATLYLVTHGVVPPAATPAEARDLAKAWCQAGGAWLRDALLRAGSWTGRRLP